MGYNMSVIHVIIIGIALEVRYMFPKQLIPSDELREHGVYKYVYKGVIIYIGKTDYSFYERFCAHHYFGYPGEDVKIYKCILPNHVESYIIEMALINQYKPVLNTEDNFPGFSGFITIKELDWVLVDMEEERQNWLAMRRARDRERLERQKEMDKWLSLPIDERCELFFDEPMF
jgi:hypothetical protein